MKHLEHIILAMEPSTPISASSVEIFLFIFCFVDNRDTATLPMNTMDTVCNFQYLCNKYKESTHHFTTEMSPTFKASFSSLVLLRHFNNQFSVSQ